MRKYDMYWSSNPDWFAYDDDLFPVLTDNAPEDAKESFKNYLAQKGYTDKNKKSPVQKHQGKQISIKSE